MTTCRNGHPRTPVNTLLNKHGKRICRACLREQKRRQYAQQFKALTPGQHCVTRGTR